MDVRQERTLTHLQERDVQQRCVVRPDRVVDDKAPGHARELPKTGMRAAISLKTACSRSRETVDATAPRRLLSDPMGAQTRGHWSVQLTVAPTVRGAPQ